MAKVPLAGTTYIPGVSEERALQEMKDMMAKLMIQNELRHIINKSRFMV